MTCPVRGMDEMEQVGVEKEKVPVAGNWPEALRLNVVPVVMGSATTRVAVPETVPLTMVPVHVPV